MPNWPAVSNNMGANANSSLKKWFSERLMSWNSTENQREMPWKGEKNPYRVWMSEIILQQTRVEQGRPYYEKFVAEYPDVSSLAMAEEEVVLKLWEGLGYYSRCRNMLSAARMIREKYGGSFPDEFEKIRALPGIGPYTAAAISSFAFNHPHAVLDGNVFRVLSRFFGIDEPVDSTNGRKLFEKLSEELLDKSRPGVYNQAIMDFGATVCKPRQPLCETCELCSKCAALAQSRVNDLPVKGKKLLKRTRWFNFLIVIDDKYTLIEKRGPKDIWEDLYQFPMLESREIPSAGEWCTLLSAVKKEASLPEFRFQITQHLSHQTIHGRFFALRTDVRADRGKFQRVNISQLKTFPFPRMITGILPQLHQRLSIV